MAGEHEYPIMPNHIDTDRHFCDAFGNTSTERFANIIVKFCQHRARGWEPMGSMDLASYGYDKNSIYLSGLRPRYIVEKADSYTVTHEFVAKCFLASPKCDVPK